MKKENFLWNYGWAILAAIIAIAVIAINLAYDYQEDFTIYKIECHNESNYRDLIDSGCIVNSTLKEDYVEYKIICPQCFSEDCDYEIKTHEVCDKTKVKEIIFPYEELENSSIIFNSVKIYVTDERALLYKKDLTKEFLVNNCEPIFYEPAEDDGIYKEGCGYRSSDGKYVCKNNNCKNGQNIIDCIKKYECPKGFEVEVR